MIERGKQSLLKFARRRGIEIAKLNEAPMFATLRGLADAHGIRTVLDVGANGGQFGRGLRSSGYAGRIISLEPLSAAYAQLQRECAADPGWSCLNVALATAPGRSEMTVAGNLGMSSSFLRATSVHDEYAPRARAVGMEAVETIDCKQLADEAPDGPCLLKLDIQGFEGEVLRSPTTEVLLTRVPVIVCEISCAPLYEGAWSAAECLRFMEDRGYGIYSVSPEWMDRKSGRMLAINGVFEREVQGDDGPDDRR